VKGFLTVKEMAARLGLSETRVRQMILSGIIKKSQKIGTVIVVPEAEVLRIEALDRKAGRRVGFKVNKTRTVRVMRPPTKDNAVIIESVEDHCHCFHPNRRLVHTYAVDADRDESNQIVVRTGNAMALPKKGEMWIAKQTGACECCSDCRQPMWEFEPS